MDKRQIGLKLSLDALGVPPRFDTFASRLVLQKVMYLAQEHGFRLGYHFSWYLRGPYSRQLTADAFAVVSAVDSRADESKQWTLDEGSQRVLAKVTALWKDRGLSAAWLELLASVHFLVSRGQVRSHDSVSLRNVLLKFGKDFSTDEIDSAVNALSTTGLLPVSVRTPIPA